MTKTEDMIKENERCYLCSLYLSEERVETCLISTDFYHKDYRQIFETIYKLWGEKLTPDFITLTRELKGVVDTSIISDITTALPSAANLTYYETLVFEASKEREFIAALRKAKDQVDAKIEIDAIIQNLIPALTEVTAARNEVGIKTATELLNTTFPEIKWIVPGLIGEGLTLINGAPKIGKSWFVLNLAIAAAAGGGFLGTLKANKTATLYLALEDTERRIHNRLKKLKADNVDNLKITTQWRDGYMGLENYLKSNTGIGLVIIDTLARFTNIDDMNHYSITTNAMARLKRIADDLNIAIILIHHAKKTGQGNSGADWLESALGSTGLTGTTDSTIFIDRDRSKKETKNTATLHATGRDAADIKYSLKFDIDCGGWTVNINTSKGQGSGSNSGNSKNDGDGLDHDWSEYTDSGVKDGSK